jgi:hypothetical protein
MKSMIKANLSDFKDSQVINLNLFNTIVQHKFDDFLVLAGGALKSLFNNKPVNDYDLFILAESTEELIKRKNSVEKTLISEGFQQTFKCQQGELSTFKYGPMKIQIINVGHKLYSSPEDIIDQFDFNLCRMAMTVNSHNLTIDPKALKDLRTKRLSIHKITNPSSTINRLVKYRNAGFNIVPAIKDFVSHFSNNVQFNIPMNLDIIYVD